MKKLVSLFVSVALVVGLCPSLAFASDGLLAGAQAALSAMAGDGFVADSVYAIIGNEYALMVSSTEDTRTVDIVGTDYSNPLHMEASVEKREKSGLEAKPKTQYWYGHLMAHGVCVKDKDTEKLGMVSFTGESLIPCQYDRVREESTGTYAIGYVQDTETSVKIAIFNDTTGEQLATTSIEMGKDDSYYIESFSKETLTVVRSVQENDARKVIRDSYSFNGSSLTLESSTESPSSASSATHERTIGNSIIEKEVEVPEHPYSYRHEYYDLSGNKIESLVDWTYETTLSGTSYGSSGEVISGGFLFSNDKGAAKSVDGTGAALATYVWEGAGTPEYYDWRTIGYYVTCKPSAGETCVFTQKGAIVQKLDEDYYLSSLPSGLGYYSYKSETAWNERLNDYAWHAILGTCFDSNMKEITARTPAIGRLLLVLPDETKAYASGLDESRNVQYSNSTSDPNVMTADGSPITLGGATLTLSVHDDEAGLVPTCRSEIQLAGSKDAFSVKSSAGKYGLMSSGGNVVLEAKYADYFSGNAGCRHYPQSDYVMVKSDDGAWRFTTVSAQDAPVATTPATNSPLAKPTEPGYLLASEEAPATDGADASQAAPSGPAGTSSGTPAGAADTPAPAAQSIAAASVTGLKAKTYTGKALTQSPRVALGGVVLVKGRDYTLSYRNNVGAGTAKVDITGIGSYTGTVTKTFKVKKAKIGSAKVSKVKAQKYKKGKAVKPKVTLKYKGKKLRKDGAYTLKYKNNKKRGTARIVIKGKGNFTGSKTVKFKIR